MKKLKVILLKTKNILIKLTNRFRYRFLYLNNSLDEKLVFFEAFQGRNFSDNPKALYLEMINNNEYQDYYFVIALRDVNTNLDFVDYNRTKIIKYQSNEYYKVIAIAKYLIANSILDMVIIKQNKQVYLQTWHGTPLKKLGWDLQVSDNSLNKPRKIKLMYLIDAKRFDLMCSPSPYYTEKIISAFNLRNLNKMGIVKELGYPRNDKLVNATPKDTIKIKEDLNLSLNKKIILYAPTWRENNFDPDNGYENDLNLDLEKLINNLTDDYLIILRLHYLVSNVISINDERIIDMSNYHDINDLYLISDFLISDYSSSIFDYALLEKPIIFYLPDLDLYQNKSRGLYFDVSKLPGPIVENQEQLTSIINNIDSIKTEYYQSIIDFKNKFNPYEDGQSSQRVVNELLKVKTK